MGNKDSKPKDIKQLCKETKMNQKEITAFYKDFKKAHPDGTVSKAEFKAIYNQQFPHGDSDAFADNIFTQFDKDGDQKLDFREFITAVGLSEKGTPAQQLTWAFDMYDLDGSGEITMRECCYMIKSVLRCYTTGADLDNQSRELTERIFANIDKNKDGKLSQKEFVEGANKDRTLLTMLEGKPLMVA